MNELINVSFEDRTNYTVFDSSDVVGQPIDHFWGPVDELKVMSRAQFVAAYPLSVPMSAQASLDFLKSYVNIYRAFDAGAALVEVFRPQGSNNYCQFNLTGTGSPATFAPFVAETALTQFDETADISIALKYPGDVPKSLFNYDTMTISVEVTASSTVMIEVIGTTNAVDTIVEQFEGGFDRSQIVDSPVLLY